jgi:hypothetical protein
MMKRLSRTEKSAIVDAMIDCFPEEATAHDDLVECVDEVRTILGRLAFKKRCNMDEAAIGKGE